MAHNLSYPLGVGAVDQGHYIMFMINETTPGKMVSAPKRPAAVRASSTGAAGKRAATGQYKSLQHSGAGKGASTLSSAPKASGLAARPGTTRMSQAITLYMPPTVKVSYKSNYKDEEIGFIASGIAGTATSAIDAFKSTGGGKEGAEKAAAAGGVAAIEGTAAFLADKAMKLVDTFAPGSSALAQISAGAILGSKMELLFTGVGRRDFSFTFNFIPKSEQEARVVYDIVQTFKEHMLPEYLAEINLGKTLGKVQLGQGRILKIPDTFDIHYYYLSNENPFLNKISTCYLTSMDINYGGDKYVTYEPVQLGMGKEGPPPQRTSITLAFSEIETITRERAEQGF